MRIALFAGTTEGRQLACTLSRGGHEVTACVATDLGAEELAGVPCRVRVGRMTAEEMAGFLPGFQLAVDATHPYSTFVSGNLRAACERTSVPLRRIRREVSFDEPASGLFAADPPQVEDGNVIVVASSQEAAELLLDQEGNILLATGSKDLDRFARLDPARLFPRILPTHAGLDACERLGIPHRNILALQGPFSTELNAAMLRQYHIRFLVTRDGGVPGGFPEKREAASLCGTILIVIGRPEDRGISVEELLKELKNLEEQEANSL